MPAITSTALYEQIRNALPESAAITIQNGTAAEVVTEQSTQLILRAIAVIPVIYHVEIYYEYVSIEGIDPSQPEHQQECSLTLYFEFPIGHTARSARDNALGLTS